MRSSESETVADKLVQSIIRSTYRRIRNQRLIVQKMGQFSAMKVINVINQIGDQLSNEQPSSGLGIYSIEHEPKPLQSDCLLPTSAQIYNQNQYQKKITKFREHQAERMRNQNKSKVESINKPSGTPFIELDLQRQKNLPNQDEPFINQLRKNKELVLKKLEQEEQKKKRKRQQEARQAAKKKEKGKEQKLNFDYEGNPMKIMSNPKNNLITETLRSMPSKESFKLKEVDRKPEIKEIEPKTSKKQIKKKKLDQIEFSEVKTLLQDLSIARGSKIVHDKTILEDKKKRLSVSEIKQLLTTSRLSKEDYMRLKESTIVTQQLEPSLANSSSAVFEEQKRKKRSHSEANLHRNLRGKIIINNQALKESYLTKIAGNAFQFPDQHEAHAQDPEQHPNRIKLTEKDRYNINYMKGNPTKSIDKKSTLSLPRLSVHSRIGETKQVIPPKYREKLKDNSLLRRQLRKKFQDKLRV